MISLTKQMPRLMILMSSGGSQSLGREPRISQDSLIPILVMLIVNSIYLTPGILYTVVAGKINEFFTRVLVNPLQIRAGDRTLIDVYPAGAYNNPISPLGNRQSDCVNKIVLKYMLSDHISCHGFQSCDLPVLHSPRDCEHRLYSLLH